MPGSVRNGDALWMWPWAMARLASDWTEMMVSAQEVIAARMPVIADAWVRPLSADHRELTRMVSEKVDAFGKSHRSTTEAQEKIGRAMEANARALGHVAGGGFADLGAWARIFERNVQIATIWAAMPAAALAPVHARATANARRLRNNG